MKQNKLNCVIQKEIFDYAVHFGVTHLHVYIIRASFSSPLHDPFQTELFSLGIHQNRDQMESNKQIIVLVALFMCVAIAQAKVYKKCELARELSDKHKFSRTLLPSCKWTEFVSFSVFKNWIRIAYLNVLALTSTGICMVESESGFNTKKVAPYPPIPGSHPPIYQSYGIFQVRQSCRFNLFTF